MFRTVFSKFSIFICIFISTTKLNDQNESQACVCSICMDRLSERCLKAYNLHSFRKSALSSQRFKLQYSLSVTTLPNALLKCSLVSIWPVMPYFHSIHAVSCFLIVSWQRSAFLISFTCLGMLKKLCERVWPSSSALLSFTNQQWLTAQWELNERRCALCFQKLS